MLLELALMAVSLSGIVANEVGAGPSGVKTGLGMGLESLCVVPKSLRVALESDRRILKRFHQLLWRDGAPVRLRQ
jgi:hypothetical protein